MKKILIVDLDGTLSDHSHRKHGLTREEYLRASEFDPPKQDVIDFVNEYYDDGYEIWIWSARSDLVKDISIEWLAKYGVRYHELQMRPDDVRIRDYILKEQWLLDEIAKDPAFLSRIEMCIDDKQVVLDMWAVHGLKCKHV